MTRLIDRPHLNMSFIPQLSQLYHSQQQYFSGDFPFPVNGSPICHDHDTSFPDLLLDSYGIIMAPSEFDTNTTTSSSLSSSSSIPERFGVSDVMMLPASPDVNTCLSSITVPNDYQAVSRKLEYEHICTRSCVSDAWPPYTTTATNYCETESKTSKEAEAPIIKIGRYSMEERREKIMRYLKKRNQRNFNKTIKYECRKTLADKRVRVRGRFAKNNINDHDQTSCQEQLLFPRINTAGSPCDEDIQNFYTIPMKQDYDQEEEWLQEAMASLLYSPHITLPNI